MSSTIQSQLNHCQQKQLSQVRYLNEQADAYRNRITSVALHKEIPDKQKRRTYNSEYERLRSEDRNRATPALTRNNLKSRSEHLKRLGAKALDTID